MRLAVGTNGQDTDLAAINRLPAFRLRRLRREGTQSAGSRRRPLAEVREEKKVAWRKEVRTRELRVCAMCRSVERFFDAVVEVAALYAQHKVLVLRTSIIYLCNTSNK